MSDEPIISSDESDSEEEWIIRWYEEQTDARCGVRTRNGKPYLVLCGPTFGSLPNTYFGFELTRETTMDEAKALAALITKHCSAFWAEFVDGPIDGQLLTLPHGIVWQTYVPGVTEMR